MCPIFSWCGDTAVWMLRIKSLTNYIYIYIYIYTHIYIYIYTLGVSGGTVNILGGGSMDYSE